MPDAFEADDHVLATLRLGFLKNLSQNRNAARMAKIPLDAYCVRSNSRLFAVESLSLCSGLAGFNKQRVRAQKMIEPDLFNLTMGEKKSTMRNGTYNARMEFNVP